MATLPILSLTPEKLPAEWPKHGQQVERSNSNLQQAVILRQLAVGGEYRYDLLHLAQAVRRYETFAIEEALEKATEPDVF